MTTLPHTSGVYQILCVPTKKVYIGSSVNIARRCRGHFERLRQGTHENTYLQHSWNKYGESAFEISVVELVLEVGLHYREQYYIDKLRATDRRKGFNISIKAGAPMYGLKHSPESLAKMSASQKGRKHTETFKKMMSERNKGKLFRPVTPDGIRRYEENMRRMREEGPSPEHRAKVSAANKAREHQSREHVFISPEGIEVRVPRLMQFCKEHGIDYSQMCKVVRGVCSHAKGWRYKDPKENSE